ncbi:prepilin peptidase [Candidatus Pantoea multigeneris]|uniref:Prepilin leader peptidase/N-methyltransferase n=1 Tax=Candidatus Pantoea multigeneris TaxID=2608357 RepID=A0ABX0RIY8_9GAMM|nr:A24 family peptidase [Pantoea multigeneris]NIF24688.1 prepilin peptidase [Pantoea multigeneris]
MLLIIDIVLLITGAAFGSFIMLASSRYTPSVLPEHWLYTASLPASRCDDCQQVLRWFELVPVISWLCLAGRCRYCCQRIPAALPLTEIFCALLFVTLPALGFQPSAIALLIVASALLLLLSRIDLRWQLLPDVLTYPLLWLGLVFSLLTSDLPSPTSAILGALVGYLSLWLIARFYRLIRGVHGLGYGDMKLFAALGAWNGVECLGLIAVIAAIGALLSHAMSLLAGRKCNHYSPQPFGPWLAVAGSITFFWQQLVTPLP